MSLAILHIIHYAFSIVCVGMKMPENCLWGVLLCLHPTLFRYIMQHFSYIDDGGVCALSFYLCYNLYSLSKPGILGVLFKGYVMFLSKCNGFVGKKSNSSESNVNCSLAF